ncbi:hypothetical protein MUK42_14701 [Musa troglodytarum]|uniref:Uncharacterized protein n=1 Tax=Musa troglodytarum TaxID=320322 RepID=A0A9E7H2S6_9LILI|nr:hypothetical protein MUK42_14701 [Musa troglodytarum]
MHPNNANSSFIYTSPPWSLPIRHRATRVLDINHAVLVRVPRSLRGMEVVSSQSPDAAGHQVVRQCAVYHPDLWGDYFITHQPCSDETQARFSSKSHFNLDAVIYVVSELFVMHE